jgi:hypothetical protein
MPQARRVRADEERHVVGDDLDHRVLRIPSVLLEERVVEADLGRARSAQLRKTPQRERGASEIQ